jgi:hypothetical protein
MHEHQIRLSSLLTMAFLFCMQLSSAQTAGYDRAVEDNSFYLEEAYNQEDGVVQHIFNATTFTTPRKDFILTFTQEWPVFQQTHQFSFTVPFQSLDGNSIRGAGDIMLNYRYQLFSAEDWITMAPRLSLILPTGSKETGPGSGSTGFQVNVPGSKRVNSFLVAHFNVGATVLPDVDVVLQDGARTSRTLTSYNLGGSLIWLASYNINFMAEFVTNITASPRDDGSVSHLSEYIVSPGIRTAIDAGSLQIVPGVAIPTRFADGDSHTGLFVYLSFEHPF